MEKFILDSKTRRERSGSVGEIDEKAKRKREEENLNTGKDSQYFKRSNKIQRSPIKSRETQSEMEVILMKLNDIQIELKEIKENGRRLQKDQEELVLELKTYQKKMQEENEFLKAKITTLEKKVQDIEEREKKIEKTKRKKNMIITGETEEKVRRDPVLLKEYVEEICLNLTGEKNLVEGAFHITKNKQGLDIIKVEMKNFEAKIKVMKKKYLLARGGRKIYINDDLTKEEADVQKILRDMVKHEKEKGNKARIGYRKININDKWIRWEELEKA